MLLDVSESGNARDAATGHEIALLPAGTEMTLGMALWLEWLLGERIMAPHLGYPCRCRIGRVVVKPEGW